MGCPQERDKERDSLPPTEVQSMSEHTTADATDRTVTRDLYELDEAYGFSKSDSLLIVEVEGDSKSLPEVIEETARSHSWERDRSERIDGEFCPWEYRTTYTFRPVESDGGDGEEDDRGVVVARGDAGTVHKYDTESESPRCGAYAPKGPASSHGAKRRGEVTVDEVDPWNLCQDCFPEEYEKYPENDHWFNVEPAWKWDGKLGSKFTCFVECSGCDFKQPCASESEAYHVGYTHKRYPDRENI